MRGWMTAPDVGVGGGRLWRGAHECPPDVMAGGRECAPSKELPTEIEIGDALSGIRDAYGARRANVLSLSRARPYRAWLATRKRRAKRGAEAPGQRTAARRLLRRVGPPVPTVRAETGESYN